MYSPRTARVGCVALWTVLAGGWLVGAPLWAGTAHLVEASAPGQVVIETSDASVDEVLAVLATRFEFAVDRNAPGGQQVRFSGRLEGSLDALLDRLLRHQGHMIVRSAEARAGISRILLLETTAGPAPTATVAGPIAAIKAKLQERQPADPGTRRR